MTSASPVRARTSVSPIAPVPPVSRPSLSALALALDPALEPAAPPIPKAPDSGPRLRDTRPPARVSHFPARAPRVAPALPQVVRTTFERFELKYWVTEPTIERIRDFVAPYLEVDAFTRARKEPQRNVSLYLDSRGYFFWNMHTSKAADRCKLRVRGYGEPPTGPAFFEVKRKVKAICLKVRATLPMAEVESVLRGRPNFELASPKDRKNLELFSYLQQTHRAEPKLLVGSFREPYSSRIKGEDVRMTIDREISYQETRAFAIAPRPGAWIPVPTPGDERRVFGQRKALLEIKFRGTAPFWLGEMVSRFGLQRAAFSKYCSAVRHAQATPSRGIS